MTDPQQLVDDNKPDPKPEDQPVPLVMPPPAPVDPPVYDQVNHNLKTVNDLGLSPQSEAQVVRRSRETNISPAFLRGVDDALKSPKTAPMGLDLFSPITAKYLASDVSNAAIFQDNINDLAGLEQLAKTAKEANDKALESQLEPVSFGEAWSYGQNVVDYGLASYAKHFEGNTQNDEWLKYYKASMEDYSKRSEQSGTLRWLLTNTLEMAPYTVDIMKEGAKYGLVTGGAAAGVVAIAGQLGPQVAIPEELVTVPTAAMAGFKIGFGTGAAARTYKIEAGSAADEIMGMKDLDGNSIDPTIGKAVAMGVGAINSGLEVFGLHKLKGILPTNWLKSKFGKAFLAKAVTDEGVKSNIKEIAKKYLVTASVEGGTEMAQEVAGVLGDYASANLDEWVNSTEFKASDKAVFTTDNLGRVMEAGKKAFAATLVLGSPGITLEVVHDHARLETQKRFQEHQDAVNSLLHSSGLAELSPEKSAEFLQLTGNGGAAYLDSQLVQQIPSETLSKLGVSTAQQELSIATGQDLRVRIEDLQLRLTPEEYKSVSAIMTNTVDGRVEEAVLPKDLEAAQAVDEEAVAKKKEYAAELSRFRSELAASVESLPKLREQARARGETAGEYANYVTQVFDKMAQRLATEGRELSETLGKLRVQAFPGGKAASGDLYQSLSPEAQDWVSKLSPEDQAALAPSIDHLTANPDPAGDKANLEMVLELSRLKTFKQKDTLRLAAPDKLLAFSSLYRQWKKANGDRTLTPKSKEWATLVMEADKVDASKGRTFEQENGTTNASFSTETNLISLFDKANLSSVLHEGAHWFLNELSQIVQSGSASESMQKDWAEVTKWLGVDLATEKDMTKIVSAHEQFARGFEEYLREGKSPTKGLAKAFSRFYSWLTTVYKEIKNLGSDRVELTDDVRRFFDRMLGSEEEATAVAQAMDMRAKTAFEMAGLGISKEDQDRINTLLATANRKTAERIVQNRNKGREALEKEWQADAEATVLSQPVYQAMGTIRKGGGLRQVVVEQQQGKDTVKALRERGLVATKNADGLEQQTIAEMHGFADADEMIIALLEAAPSEKAAVDAYVAEQAREYDASFSAEEEMLDTEEYQEYLEIVNRYLHAALGPAEVVTKEGKKVVSTTVSRRAFTLLAEQQMLMMTMADAINVNEHLATMKKVLKVERRAILAGDFKTALIANEQARLAFERAKLSKEARDIQTKTIRNGNKAARAEKGTIEEQHHLNLVNLLQRYGLLGVKNKLDLTRREPILSLFTSTDPLLNTEGLFGDWLMDEKGTKPFKDLTLGEFKELSNLVKFLNGRGRSLVNDELRALGVNALAAQSAILENMKGQKTKRVISEGETLASVKKKWRGYMAWGDQLWQVLRTMDNYTNVGHKGKVGPAEKMILYPLSKAATEKMELLKGIEKDMLPHIQQLQKSMLEHGKVLIKPPIPPTKLMQSKGQLWTFERVLSAALNMGNEYNRTALMEGNQLSESDLNSLTGILSNEDWKAIQGIWDGINSLWPKMSEVFYRLNYFHQDKVQAKSFTSPSGQEMRGGYYPVKFDPELSDIVGAQSETENLMDEKRSLFPTPKVKAGLLKGRVGTGGKPIRLSLGVIGSHLETATQYITHAEIVRDVDTLLTKPGKHGTKNAVKAEIERTQGESVAELIRPTLAHIARPESAILDEISSFFERSRALSTAYLLGLNFRVASLQFTGATTIIADLGANHYAKGFFSVAMSPWAAFNEMRALSPAMANRAQIVERDIKHSLKPFSLNETTIKGVSMSMIRSASFVFIWMADAMVTLPAWWGAYYKAMASNGGNQKAAVASADELITATNPSARPLDLSAWQRSPVGWHRLFTMFSTFTFKYGNRMKLFNRAWRAGQISSIDYMRQVMLEAILPPLMMGIGLSMLRGDEPDEDDAKKAALNVFLYQFQGLPFLRDVVSLAATQGTNALISDKKKKEYVADPTKSPVFAGVDLLTKSITSFTAMAADMNDDKKVSKVAWAFADLASFKLGVPVPKLARNLMEGMRQWEEEGGTAMNVLAPDANKKESKK